MSLEITSSDRTSSVQPPSHTSDGGAGNLGYFQQEKKKKEEDKEETDTFEFTTKKEDNEDIDKSPDSIGLKIRTFWFNLHGIFNEVVDNSDKSQK